jgi:hypothetical protein
MDNGCLRWLGRDEPDVGDGRAAVERIIRDSNPATRDEEGRGDRTALVSPFACRGRVKMSASGQVEMSAFGDVVSLGLGSRAVEATERMCQTPGWPHSKGVVLDLPILCSSSSAR